MMAVAMHVKTDAGRDDSTVFEDQGTAVVGWDLNWEFLAKVLLAGRNALLEALGGNGRNRTGDCTPLFQKKSMANKDNYARR